MTHLAKAVVKFRLNRTGTDQEPYIYFEGFCAYGRTPKEARENVYNMIKLKRDQFETQKINYIEFNVMKESELKTLPVRVQKRVRNDWEVALIAGFAS